MTPLVAFRGRLEEAARLWLEGLGVKMAFLLLDFRASPAIGLLLFDLLAMLMITKQKDNLR